MEEEAGCSVSGEEDSPDEEEDEEEELSEEDADDEEGPEEELSGAASRGQESDVKSITSVMKNAVFLIA